MEESVLYIWSNQCNVHYCVAAIIGFREVTLEVVEDGGPVSVTVAVLGDMLADNAQVTVRLYTEAGTASGQWSHGWLTASVEYVRYLYIYVYIYIYIYIYIYMYV